MKKMKNKNNIVECPNCKKQAIITTTVNNMAAMILLSSLGMLFFIFIPVLNVIFVPVLFIIFVLASIIGLIAMLKGGATIKCSNCNTKYKLNKEEYKIYKA